MHLLDRVAEFVGVVHIIALIGLVSSISLIPGGGNGHGVDPIIGGHLVLLLELLRLCLGFLHDEVNGDKEDGNQEKEEEEIQVLVAVVAGAGGTGCQIADTKGGVRGNRDGAAGAASGDNLGSDVRTTGRIPPNQVESFTGSGRAGESDIDEGSGGSSESSVDDQRVGGVAGSCKHQVSKGGDRSGTVDGRNPVEW